RGARRLFPPALRSGGFLLFRLHDRSATVGRAALAEVESFELVVVLTGSLVLIVVGELLARLDRSPGVDKNLLAGDDRFTVGIARVVDEAGVATARRNCAVDDRVLVEGEQEGMVALHPAVVVAAVGL